MPFSIVNVTFNEYYSDVPQELIENMLKNAECNLPGKLKLILEPNRKLIQKGPYILPPIRWVDSFEKNAEFDITCDVK
nr:putative maintenance protein [Saccharomycopsis crataegensis]